MQILVAASSLQTLSIARTTLEQGHHVDMIGMHFPNPEFSSKRNEDGEKMAKHRKYDLAAIRLARDVMADWGWKDVGKVDDVPTYSAMAKHLKKISGNTELFIKRFFDLNSDIHEFMYRHGDHIFRACFPFEEKEPEPVPESIKKLLAEFSPEPYWPRYDLEVKYDNKKLFVRDGWSDGYHSSSRTAKIEEWKRMQPIVL